jgi:hypothetical protein
LNVWKVTHGSSTKNINAFDYYFFVIVALLQQVPEIFGKRLIRILVGGQIKILDYQIEDKSP